MTDELALYFNVRDELAVVKSLVMRGSDCLVVPVSLRSRVLDLAHEGHQGIVRTKQRLRELYWWPHMDKCVETIIGSCVPCQCNDKAAKTAPAPPVELRRGPWEKVAIDITGPFECATWDCRYAITPTDYYSKWPEVAFVPTVMTDMVICFLGMVFSREGNPSFLVSDNGCQFTSHDFANFLREREIKHLRSSVYYPRANGAIERLNRVLKDCIQTAERMRRPWKQAVTEFLQNYCATTHATTGATPFELLRNRKMRTELNVLPVSDKIKSHEQVKDTVHHKQQKSKEYADRKAGAKVPTFQVSDTVRVRRPWHVHKGSCRFIGPLTVIKKVGSSTYLLSDGRKWNASKLAPFPKKAMSYMDKDRGTVLDGLTLPENIHYENERCHAPEPDTRRGLRNRKPPQWLTGFVK